MTDHLTLFFIRGCRIIRFSLATSILLLTVAGANAQNSGPTDGSTPLGMSPGSPAGSYSLSGFDNINFFNGKLSFHMPLIHMGGRGTAGYTMTLPIETHWSVRDEFYGNAHHYYPTPSEWSGLTPGYGPGVLNGRLTGIADYDSCAESLPSLTRLTFTAGDGTEYELRDTKYNGAAKENTYSGGPGQCSIFLTNSRGKVFTTADGTAATFISDADIADFVAFGVTQITPSGYLLLADGTRYRIDNGDVTWIRDRNGNRLTFSYGAGTDTITDSLNRQVSINYGYATGHAYDEVSFKGFGGAARTIRIWHSALSQALRAGYSIQTYQQLFPGSNSASGTQYNPGVVSAVELPDGRSFQFRYNSYGELARFELPTGGGFEYDYDWGTAGQASGVSGSYRRVVEKRIYADGTTLQSRTTFSRPESMTPNPGYVEVEQRDGAGTLLGRERHYYYGSSLSSFVQEPTAYSPWKDGREYKTEIFDIVGGNPVLRRVIDQTWQQPVSGSTWPLTQAETNDSAKPNDPQITQTVTTLADSNQIAKQTFAYDKYSNRTDSYDYDFGSGAAGSLVRRTHTDYLATNSINSVAYDTLNPNTTSPDPSATVHLRDLPVQQSVYDAGGIERARWTFEYDNYASDTNHVGLLPRSNISGLDSAYTTSYTTRGNVTANTHYLLTSGSVTGSVTAYAQYDVAGNVVRTIDARACATNIDYSDRFGSPDGEARNNSGATELGAQYSYAFPTLVTNCLGQTAYSQFDYYLGRPVDSEDANGVVSSSYSDVSEPLDRPTKVVRAANQGATVKSQTLFSYDDSNRIVTATSDQSNFGDGVLVSKTLYDGLGRMIESRQYEGGTNYIAVQTQYDALGRAFKTSSPFRPWQSESALWITTGFDALGRMISVTTPDNAAVSTYYNGNQVLVKDQAGKELMSRTNALGQLSDVWEITPSDQWTEGVSFPGHSEVTTGYHTLYAYDALDNLTSVTQGAQPARTFSYDSFKRLTSASNPESGAVNYQYDDNGNLVVKTDARGASAHYSYDALNRVTRRWYNGSSSISATTNDSPALPSGVGATDEVNYSYDTASNGKGRLAAVSSGVSSSSYGSYDAMGRVLSAAQILGGQTYSMSYGYDLAGHEKTMAYPSTHAVTYNYDSAGRLADKDVQHLAFTGNLGDGGAPRNYSTGISYAPFGGLAQEKFGTNTAVFNKLLYNSRQQLAEILASTTSNDAGWDRGKIINSYSDQCSGATCNGTDNNGNLKMQQHWIPNADGNPAAIFTQQYDYDSLNRLWRVSDDRNFPGWRQQYSYDRWGSRTIDQSNTWNTGVPTWSFGVDPNTNRLTPPGGWTMTYDAVGNLTNDTYTGQGQRTYDAENRMKQAWAGGQWQTYSYDGDGRRVKRNVNNTETWQVYGVGGELIAEYAQNASYTTPQKEYGYRNGQLLITATVTAGSGGSPFSFTDDPVIAGSTTVKALHLTELRTAVNQARAHAGLSAANWTDDPVQATVTTIKAVHITELRARLDEARAALGLSAASYTDPTLTAGSTTVKAIHIQELRTRTNEALTAGSGGGLDLRWLVSDQLGTPRLIFDQSGLLASISRHDYLPYGEELSGGSRTPPLGYTNSDGARQHFTSKERDNETGLDYFEARYFSSTQGRFTSTDPLYYQMMMAIDPQRFNLYSYARNNPVKFIDPSGEKLYLRGNDDWLRTNVLYEMAGGQENFARYFEIADGQVVTRSGVNTSGANSGVQALLGLVNASENYSYFAGTNGNEAVALFNGINGNNGAVTQLNRNQTRQYSREFEGNTPNNQGGYLVGTNGRYAALHPQNLANGDPVFAVIAYNTNAVQQQTGVSSATAQGPDLPLPFMQDRVMAIQRASLNQNIRPVSFFIHETEENRNFASLPASARQGFYGSAHRYAGQREAEIRQAVHITGGFAGGIVTSRVPR